MTITLSNQTMSASIHSMGAQLISLKDKHKKEYMWQRDADIWPRCSPLLFPAIGNSRNGKTLIEDRWYDLPKHGFCKGTDFLLEHQTKTSVTFSITDTEQTRTMYPYKFKLSLTYTLTEDGISMDYLVENQDMRPIFYSIGAHPGFQCPLEDGEQFEDYQLEFEQEETISSMTYDLKHMQFDRESRITRLDKSRCLPLDYSMFDQDAVYFDELKSRKVSMVHRATKKGVEVSYPGFSSVAFWTPAGVKAPFLCVEPWNGSAICSDEDDQFIHKHDIQALATGAQASYHLGIRIL